jgi:hypothetical protein
MYFLIENQSETILGKVFSINQNTSSFKFSTNKIKAKRSRLEIYTLFLYVMNLKKIKKNRLNYRMNLIGL